MSEVGKAVNSPNFLWIIQKMLHFRWRESVWHMKSVKRGVRWIVQKLLVREVKSILINMWGLSNWADFEVEEKNKGSFHFKSVKTQK